MEGDEGAGLGDGDVWNDFGQKVDLTARLREILINYPEGTSILKELVQNAVSARAPAPSAVSRDAAHVPRRVGRIPASSVALSGACRVLPGRLTPGGDAPPLTRS
jgi:hypothetical protein